eukprot:5984616-Prymnesium_polylepis.1
MSGIPTPTARLRALWSGGPAAGRRRPHLPEGVAVRVGAVEEDHPRLEPRRVVRVEVALDADAARDDVAAVRDL